MTTKVTKKKETAKTKPVKKLRVGPISVTVWKNEEIPSVVFERNYKDKNGEWQTSNRFSVHDLPIIAWLSEQVFLYLQEKF